MPDATISRRDIHSDEYRNATALEQPMTRSGIGISLHIHMHGDKTNPGSDQSTEDNWPERLLKI